MVNFSLEYFPPNDQAGLEDLSYQASVMSAYSPLYMSITHSAKGAEINETMQTVRILKEQLSVKISPHMTCSSYSKAEIIKMAEVKKHSPSLHKKVMNGSTTLQDAYNEVMSEINNTKEFKGRGTKSTKITIEQEVEI